MENNFIYLLFGINALFTLILLIFAILNGVKIKKLKSKYKRFMRISGEKNIEELLEFCIGQIEKFDNELNNSNNEIEALNKNIKKCIQKVGIVRYNAYENIGSNLSYSIALLDNFDNGVVISSLYSRDSCSTYAKPVVAGKSSFPLSDEEIEAIQQAIKQHTQ